MAAHLYERHGLILTGKYVATSGAAKSSDKSPSVSLEPIIQITFEVPSVAH